MDATPWFLTRTLQWLWVMVRDTVAFCMIHPHRSKEAFAALIDDWAGILVSDGYGVYQTWVAHRQTCLAHLLRTARRLAERQQPALAACSTYVERILSLKKTCHLHACSIYPVLIDAITRFFHGQQPDLPWLNKG